MAIEEIVVSAHTADPVDTWDSEDRKVDAVLEQYSSSGRKKYRFELLNRQLLSTSIAQSRRKIRSYELYLCVLDPKPHRSLSVSWHHLVVSLAFILAGGVAAASGHPPYSTAVTAGLGLSAGLALVLAARNSHLVLVFHSRTGRIPLLSFLFRKPDPHTFNKFIAILLRHIGTANSINSAADANESLNMELREHRRLMESGIISAKNYERAKSRILSKHC